MIRRTLLIGLLSLAVFAAAQQNDTQNPNARPSTAQPADPHSGEMPLTTKVPEARRLVNEAMMLYLDQVEQTQSIEILRAAIKIDPNFAMAHEFLFWISLDPAEQIAEQKQAFATRTFASPAEQLLIEWAQDAADHKLISAIMKMNDVLSQYPHDKWVVWATTWWLMNQTQYERAADIFERSGISDFPGLNNNMGYIYASTRQFDKAFQMMDKYVGELPKDANPQDSYAEILRMAGRFDRSIEHYRAALAINPDFYSSQFGIADTYSLMGDQVRARREYEIGFQKFPDLPELHRVQWQTREATTYVRERDYQQADRAFQAIADYAHAKQMSQIEADSYRQMAMYQPNSKDALALLDKAETANNEGKNAMPIAISQEAAQIQRARVEAALKLGDKEVAKMAFARLVEMSQNADDKPIAAAYEGAAGAMLCSEHKYKEAVSHLEEDSNNPLSLRLLAAAYEKTKDRSAAERTTETLANLNDPSLEQALVVPAFRKCYQEHACTDVAASLK